MSSEHAVDAAYKKKVDDVTLEMYRTMAQARRVLTSWVDETRASPEAREAAQEALRSFSEVDSRLIQSGHQER